MWTPLPHSSKLFNMFLTLIFTLCAHFPTLTSLSPQSSPQMRRNYWFFSLIFTWENDKLVSNNESFFHQTVTFQSAALSSFSWVKLIWTLTSRSCPALPRGCRTAETVFGFGCRDSGGLATHPSLALRTHGHLLPLWWRHVSGDPPRGTTFTTTQDFVPGEQTHAAGFYTTVTWDLCGPFFTWDVLERGEKWLVFRQAEEICVFRRLGCTSTYCVSDQIVNGNRSN